MGAGGVDAPVRALLALPNGEFIVGGDFGSAGGTPANRIARWNGGAWTALGSGADGPVFSLERMSGGDLAVGGGFLAAGGVPAAFVARWDFESSAWSALGAGTSGAVFDMVIDSNGDLIAGGAFTVAGGGAANRVARWNEESSAWSAMGLGVAPQGAGGTAIVTSLAMLPTGAIAAAGAFDIAGGISGVADLAVWDGTEWSPLGSTINATILSLAALPGGDVVAGGEFRFAGFSRANRIARWNGAGWSALGSGMNGIVHAVVGLPNGDVVAGGEFTTAGGVNCNHIARWDGVAWSPLGTGTSGGINDGPVFSLLALSNGDVIAGGWFGNAGGVPARRVARWDGVTWSAMGAGVGPTNTNVTRVSALVELANGDVVAGGSFTTAGGAPASNVAKWDGAGWSSMDGGTNEYVGALTAMPGGGVVAGGWFTAAGGIPANHVARWDADSKWSALGTGMARQVFGLTTMANGDVVAGGEFAGSTGTVARWNGATWQPLDVGLWRAFNGRLNVLKTSATGEVLAGGFFDRAGANTSSNFARWTDDPEPRVAADPEAQAVMEDGTAWFSATPVFGTPSVSYQWLRDGVAIVNGPGGASSGGGVVSGASGSFPSYTEGTPVTLTIEGVRPSDAGEYSVVLSNGCGSDTSEAAELEVGVDCPADFDGDGFMTGVDYDLYVQAFEAGDESADFDGDGFVTGLDFDLYVQAYEAGC